MESTWELRFFLRCQFSGQVAVTLCGKAGLKCHAIGTKEAFQNKYTSRTALVGHKILFNCDMTILCFSDTEQLEVVVKYDNQYHQ